MTRREALDTFDEMRRQATDIPEIALDEINSEIRAAHAVREAMRSVGPNVMVAIKHYGKEVFP